MATIVRILSVLVVLGLVGLGVAAAALQFDYAVLPEMADVLNRDRLEAAAYDVMGRRVSEEEAARLLGTPEGRKLLSPEAGAVRVDDALARLGREVFYRETFGNEVFLTDVLGLLDGALTPRRLAWALWRLHGAGTDDLAVTLDSDVLIGDRTRRAGEVVSTGLAVPKGEYLPIGVRLFYDRGRVRVGLTCALCHARLDPGSGRVVEGAPNTRLQLGLMLALASNPAAMFGHSGIASFGPYLQKPENMVRTSTGTSAVLPDPETLEADVRTMLAAWPPGSFDATLDGVNNPTSTPSLFVAESHPYGWSGQAALGPFRGLASMGGDLHGLAVDPTARAAAAPALLNVDPEVYLGTMLQRAPTSGLRFEPWDGRKPSEILAAVDPQPGTPGLTRLAALPTAPLASFVTLNGFVPARPDEPVGLALNGLAAFAMLLRPPDAPPDTTGQTALGRDTFEKAGCRACHSGPSLTSNRVWPAATIGSEPSRAAAFAATEAGAVRPQIFGPNIGWPAPRDPRLIDVPVADLGQLRLAWGYNRTGGGYKVPGLVGLAWTAPYLHDGGVAVGPDPERVVGLPDIAGSGPPPDPANSLRALLDRSWRARVVAANENATAARIARVTGRGHAYWADREAGFTDAEREALITFLLSVDRPSPGPAP